MDARGHTCNSGYTELQVTLTLQRNAHVATALLQCKQGRDDIIVKVNLQSPIPTSLYITLAN